jgi:hypothetical protein
MIGVAAVAAVTLAAPAALSLTGMASADTAPDPCATPMVFLGPGADGNHTQAFYRASCSTPAIQVTSDPVSDVVLMPSAEAVAVIVAPTPVASAAVEIIDIATKAVTVVSDTPTHKLGLSVAPDGHAFAYYQDPIGNTTRAGIYVQPVDGSPAYRVGGGPEQPGAGASSVASEWTAWSHDSSRVAYPLTGGPAPFWSAVAFAQADQNGGGQQQTILPPVPGSVTLQALAWTPDDQGFIVEHVADQSGSLDYIGIADQRYIPLASEAGRSITSLSVDQHWTAFVTSAASSGPDTSTTRIDALWLGDAGTFTPLPSVTGSDAGPGVNTAGPADPAPAGFPTPGPPWSPTPTPTPTTPTPAPTPTPTPTATQPADCPDVMLYGLRGSRNLLPDPGASDAVLYQFAAAFAKQAKQHGFTNGAVAVPYQAISVPAALAAFGTRRYDASVASGVRPLRNLLTKFIAHCPLSYAATVGYSQGQQVAREAYAGLSPEQQKRVAFLTGFGDPLSSNAQPDANQGGHSVLQGVYYAAKARDHHPVHLYLQPPHLVKRLQDWCHSGDPVCHYSPWNLATNWWQHLYAGTNYINRAADLAAARTAGLLGKG